MNITNINYNYLINILNNYPSNIIYHGSKGFIVEYDDKTLFKLYYRRFYEPYIYMSETKFKDEFNYLKRIEKSLNCDSLANLNYKLDSLKNVENGTYKGIVTYNNYPIGVLENYYKDYKNLECYSDFSYINILKIFDRINEKLIDLYNKGIYPLNIKLSDILINSNLDIKLVDLDDFDTIYSSECCNIDLMSQTQENMTKLKKIMISKNNI